MYAKIEQKQNILLEPPAAICNSEETMTKNLKYFKKQTLNLPALSKKKWFKEKYYTYAKKKVCVLEQYRIILSRVINEKATVLIEP